MTELTQDEIPSTQKKPLKPEHLVFAEAYLRLLHRADAYHVAYPSASRETCYANGSELLKNTEIAAYVDERMAELTMRPAEILRRMSDMAQATLKPFINVTDEGFVYFDFSDPEAMNYVHLIKKIKSKRTRRLDGESTWEDELVEVELYDAKDALKELGKQHKLFTDNVTVGNPDGSALMINVTLQKDD
jgi:phage terminase small subunit